MKFQDRVRIQSNHMVCVHAGWYEDVIAGYGVYDGFEGVHVTVDYLAELLREIREMLDALQNQTFVEVGVEEAYHVRYAVRASTDNVAVGGRPEIQSFVDV